MEQKGLNWLIKTVFFCLFANLINNLSQEPVWLTNSDIQAGVVTICSNSAYLNGANPLYTQAYTSSFSTVPNVGISTPTIDISPTPTYMEWKVNLPQSTNQTHLKINMNYLTTSFNTFKVGFISVSGSISYLKVDYRELTFSTGIAAGIGDRSTSGNFNLNIVINSTHDLSLIPYISGLKISTTSGDYKFGLIFTKNNDTNVLYNATVSGSTQVTYIVAYILIFDITLGEQTQTLFLDYQPLIGFNNTLNSFSLVFFDKTNILVGIGQFSFTSGFSFNLIMDNLTLTVPSSGSGAYFTSVSFSFWSFRERSCNAATPYYEKISNLCYDICPSGFLPVDPEKYCNPCSNYMNYCKTCSNSTSCQSCIDGYYPQASICQMCYYTCVTCSGSTSNDCLSCNELDRTLSGSQCVCKSGIEDSSGNCISNCDDVNCMVCKSDVSYCEQCKDSTFILSGGKCSCPLTDYYSTQNVTCYPCHLTCALCSGPAQTDCLSCYSSQNRQLNQLTFQCQCKPTYYSPNSQLTCIKQPSPTSCPQYFVYNQTRNICVEICGDGRLFELPCDDGNLDTNDGCDQNCNVQNGFICLYGDQNSPSICSYNGQIAFVLLDSIKETYDNQLILSYRLQPQLKFYGQFSDFTNNLLISNQTLSIVSASYSINQKILYLTLSYNQTVAGKDVQLQYVPPSSPYFHSTLKSSFLWSVSVSNGLSLNHYQTQIYKNSKVFENLVLGIYVGCLVVAFFSLFFRKMIGAELIILAQTQVLSISILKEVHPYLSPLLSNNYIFGYNGFQGIINMKRGEQIAFNKMLSTLGFSSVFGQNVNIMLFVIISIYLLALILGLASTFMQKSMSKKMKKAALILATQIAFGSVLFILMDTTASYSIEVFQQTIWQFTPEYSGSLKIIGIIFVFINYGVYIIFYKQSIESYVFYNKRSKLSQLQPLFIATKAILIALGILLYQKLGTSMCYTLMGLQITYVLFLCVIRPFKRVIDLIRAIFVELTLTYVLGLRYVLSQFINLSNPGQLWDTFLQIGIPIEYGLVGIALITSFISLILHLIKVNKHQAQIHPQEMYSEIDLLEKKQEKIQINQKQQPPSIQSYVEDFLGKNKQSTTNYTQKKPKLLKYKIEKKYKGLFSSEELKQNSSLGQLIDFNQGEVDDGIGNDSRRKMKDDNFNKQKSIINKNLDIIQMDDD